jgi:deoxycytidylate deaminase
VIEEKFSEAVKILALSSSSRRKVGCILLRKGRIVASSTNVQGKTHPLQLDFAIRAGEPSRTSLHAEIRALIKSRIQCDTLIVGRVNKKGELCMSKPCPVCQLAIRESGIGNIYYSTDFGVWEKLELPS